jgi:O-acetylserine/cysteine efflux transporter
MALCVMLIWGVNFAVAKVTVSEMPPLMVNAIRFALVALILVPCVKVPRGQLVDILILATIMAPFHFGLMFIGLTGSDAAAAAIAMQLSVPFAALMASFYFHDRLGRQRTIGMIIAFAGVVVLAGEPKMDGELLMLGLIVLSAAMWGVGNIQIKRIGDINPFALSAWMALFAAPELLVLSLLLEQDQFNAVMQANWTAWGGILYMAVLVAIVSYAMWYHLLRTYQVNQVVPFSLLGPVFGVAAGILLLGEAATWQKLLGGAVTIAGVAMISLYSPRPKPLAEDCRDEG